MALKVLELFGGIGACTQALKLNGVDIDIADYVEIDKYAVKSYNAINGTNFEPQDITKWDKDIDVDLIMHGSPCQDFSLAGNQRGGDEGSGTRSSLMYETLRIVEKLHPTYVIWENVKNVLSKNHKHNFDKYIERMNALGYESKYQVLNAKDYGVPQNRERVFVVSVRGVNFFEFPEKEELKIRLKDVLEMGVDEKYYLSDTMQKYVFNFEREHKGCGFSDNVDKSRITPTVANTLGCSSACGGQRSGTSTFVSDDVEENITVADYKKQIGWFKQPENVSDKEPKVDILGNIYGAKTGSGYAGNVYNTEEISPCLNTMGGGNRQPMVVTEPSIKIRVANKKGYDEAIEGDSINLQQPSSSTRRGRVGHQVAQTLDTGCAQGVVNNGLRVRKLTPKECWRLMAFPDEAFNKAAEVNSNTQLYKQAGNSIVVAVLQKIFANLL